MNGDFVALQNEMQAALQALPHQHSDYLRVYVSAIEVVGASVRSLHSRLDKYQFQKPEDEIFFFKKVKPVFDSELLFYTYLIDIWQSQPHTTDQALQSYYKERLNDLQWFYDECKEFVMYCRLDADYLDPLYFLRSSVLPPLYYDDLPRIYEPQYNTPRSQPLAKLLAFDRLQAEITTMLQLSDGSDPAARQDNSGSPLTWTAGVSNLVELLYALEEYGVFNNTKVGIKKLAVTFSNLFSVSLDNIYKIYENIRLRKKSRTPFLDGLRSSLLRRMEHDDEFAL